MDARALLLLAEDDPDDQFFFQEALEVVRPANVETHIVFDGAQLMKLLREKSMEAYLRRLVVLDLNMRVQGGRETLDEIRSVREFESIPVVVLTTSLTEEDIEYCKQHGATAYFRKPDSIVELVEIVRGLCRDYLG